MVETRDLPLFAFGEALRRARRRRRALLRRSAFGTLGFAALALTIAFPPRPRLVWNASASVPLGLYGVGLRAPIARGDLVLAWLPEPARTLAAKRRYLPRNVPAIKRVAATAGARVCGHRGLVTIDGQVAAHRLAADRFGRPLPRWQGCRTLGPGELLLLNARSPDSFDGRYFGVSRTGDVIGTVRSLWTYTQQKAADA
ncbi:S26 family signal peptidase [Sphingomonas cannabina]|uniref:S26 family signal peptidase n=1 Tax=Sphingomonas cannabina TaxID=2899123 RepID=UPI001F37AA15|nr:S26 family signal peptidase [Sphingomonas cannabina]UIJ46260.1 S26 family signal peptidase [Sphingomonas cannabina]